MPNKDNEMPLGYPRQYFWLPYVLTIASIVILVLQMADAFAQVKLGWTLVLGFIIAAIVVAAYGFRHEFKHLEVPEKHTPQHYFLVLWHSVQAAAVAFGLHGAFYALFWFAIKLFETGDEAVFFIILLFVVPTGFIMGAVSRLWQWSVVKTVNEMKVRGIELPHAGPHLTPIGSYIWLWKYGKGVEIITERRIPAGGAFCAVFFLGVVGFFIIQGAIGYHTRRLGAA